MKKLHLLLAISLLLACVCIACAGAAEEAAMPGDTVTVPVTISSENAAYVRVKTVFDESVFEWIGYEAEGDGQTGPRGIVIFNINGIPSGKIGTVTLKIKETAAPGEYTVSGVVEECFDINEQDCAANPGAVKITVGPVATATPAPTPTAEPTVVPTEEPTVAPTEEPTVAPTQEPTPAPTAPSGKPQYILKEYGYGDGYVTGVVEHVDGTPEAAELRVRVTLFLTENRYLVTYGIVYDDGEFEAPGSRDVEHIVLAIMNGKPAGEEDNFKLAVEWDI
jgi:hypothetical protein